MRHHVAPHRWADLWAGRVDNAQRSVMERHAERCAACARVRRRVTRASDSFASIRTRLAPEVSWDEIRARVHWSVSTERRAALRKRRPAYGWIVAATAAGVAAALATGGIPPPAATQQPVAVRSEPAAPPAPPAPLVGLVNRVAGDVMVDGVRPSDLFARALTQGSSLATGDGRVDVQFGTDSAFALGPMSTLALRRFDARTIELAIEGTVDITVALRADGQRFLVDAGERVIEVRGTRFRVSHDARITSVACLHGRVTVSDKAGKAGKIGKIEVGAAQRFSVAAGRPVSGEHTVALSAEDSAAFIQAPLALPLWGPAALQQSSAPLEIATVGRRGVRVDGIELGTAPLRVRVMPGRHGVEAADNVGVGRFRRAGWVDVAAGPTGARLAIPAEPPPTSGITERRRQLRAGIARPLLDRCVRSIAKAGLTGTYVQIEIAVDAQGAIGFLNVLDTDLPSATASCVREVLAGVRFGRGSAATWHEHVDL
jgi:hypothetical protein